MNAVEKIEEKLRKYPHVKYEANKNSIAVYPNSEDGFSVRLTVDAGLCTVFFNGWHEDFQDEGEALNCFAFGLSNNCRLKEFRRGDFAYKWIVETKENENWTEDSTTGLLIFPFWRKKTVRCLRNDLLK